MSHGGHRNGSGRPKGAKSKLALINNQRLAGAIQEHSEEVIDILIKIAKTSSNDNARISACNLLLNRCYGKVPLRIEPNTEVRPTTIILTSA